jgi:hypothetical protein
MRGSVTLVKSRLSVLDNVVPSTHTLLIINASAFDRENLFHS